MLPKNMVLGIEMHGADIGSWIKIKVQGKENNKMLSNSDIYVPGMNFHHDASICRKVQ